MRIGVGMKAVKKHDFGKPVKKPETIGVLGKYITVHTVSTYSQPVNGYVHCVIM